MPKTIVFALDSNAWSHLGEMSGRCNAAGARFTVSKQRQHEIVLKHLKRYKPCYWAWTRASAPQRVRGDRAKIQCRSKCFGCMCYLNELSFSSILLPSPLQSCSKSHSHPHPHPHCVAANMWFSPFQTFRQLFQKCWWSTFRDVCTLEASLSFTRLCAHSYTCVCTGCDCVIL